MRDLGDCSDNEIDTWILNYETKFETSAVFYRELLEERAKRGSKILSIDHSLRHLIATARNGTFTTYGTLASENGASWKDARRLMNGKGGHLDRLLDVCHARGIPLLTSLCVNKRGVDNGMLEPTAIKGFTNGARRLGYSVTDEIQFLQTCQKESFEWAASTNECSH